MLPASVAIRRTAAELDPDDYLDVSFEPMGRAMQSVLGDRAEAITFGVRIFVTPAVFDDIVGGSRPDIVLHELAHVDQWRREGKRFLPSYVGEYLRFRILGAPHEAAYRSISYEIDAFEAGLRSQEPNA